MHRLGLRNRRGGKISINGLSWILNNPFYIGLIRLKRSGETFAGSHEPLIPKALFDRVQSILNGKTNAKAWRHDDFIFRRLLNCKQCGSRLIGEIQKGHTYYRCHIRACHTKCVREETVEEKVLEMLSPIQLSSDEITYFEQRLECMKATREKEQEQLVKSATLRLGQLQDRLARLTDAFIDGAVEREIFEERKAALLMERKDIEDKLGQLRNGSRSVPDELTQFLELIKSPYLNYKMGLVQEKRDLLKILTSNRLVDGKKVQFELTLPFSEIANRSQVSNGAPLRDRHRTLDKTFSKLVKFFKAKLSAEKENEDYRRNN